MEVAAMILYGMFVAGATVGLMVGVGITIYVLSQPRVESPDNGAVKEAESIVRSHHKSNLRR